MKFQISIIVASFFFMITTSQAQVDLISMIETSPSVKGKPMAYTQPMEVKDFYPIDEEAIVLNYAEVCQKMTYPAAALDNGIEGMVHVRLLIDETGQVQQYHILGPHPSMEKEVEKYIKDIKFQAAHLDHYPVTSWGNLSFKFEITD
jgi:TonB family protein